MADEKMPPKRPTVAGEPRDQVAISEDIARIVGYLNAKRTIASERTNGLAQDLSFRRDEVPDEPAHTLGNQSAGRLAELVEVLPEPVAKIVISRNNPALAERYHSFCHDLDLILESFKARLEGDKPVQH